MNPAAFRGIGLTPLDPAGYRRTPWKNGGGVAIDIAEAHLPGIPPGSWDGMVWRFGRTAIVTPAPFSDLSGFDRHQVLVAGRGLVLDTSDGEIDVRTPFTPVRFAGETPIHSRLEAGPVEVVNLIGDRARVSLALACLKGGETLDCPAGLHIAYAATTSCDLLVNGDACTIEADHALRIDATERFTVTSRDGTIIIASIWPMLPASCRA
ncbi:MAG: HutD family protein [bacterium]|nr:HutD family protein [bacterium]